MPRCCLLGLSCLAAEKLFLWKDTRNFVKGVFGRKWDVLWLKCEKGVGSCDVFGQRCILVLVRPKVGFQVGHGGGKSFRKGMSWAFFQNRSSTGGKSEVSMSCYCETAQIRFKGDVVVIINTKKFYLGMFYVDKRWETPIIVCQQLISGTPRTLLMSPLPHLQHCVE